MSEWVPVCETEGAQPVEIETDDDGTMPLASIIAHFPGTTTLKFRAPGGTAYRGVKMKEDILIPPTGGWSAATLYIAVNPTADAMKRKREEEAASYQPAFKKGSYIEPDDDTQCRDMILLGMKPSTSEAQVREYFKDKADVVMVQMKKSKDNMTGYAFIKFSDKDVEKDLRRQKHMIDGRECTLKIPDSRAHQGERGDRKVYVSYHDETLSNDEMRQHFEQFGEVEDVFVPTPWRHFAFVTFTSAAVAQSLIGKEHNVRGVSLLMKKGQAPKNKRESEESSSGGERGGWGDSWGSGPGAAMADQWQMYAKMMQESMYRGGPPLPPGAPRTPWDSMKAPGRGGPDGPPGGYSWPGQSGYGYGGDRGSGGYGPPGVSKY